MPFNKLLLLSVLLIPISASRGADFEIKSLRVYSAIEQTSFPLIDYSDPSKKSLSIEFDIAGDYMPNLNIIFRFCDSDWNPTDNPFLLNPMGNTEHNLWFETLPASIRGARYHYHDKFPNNNVSFPWSGKWRFFIVDSQNPGIIYATGRFYSIRPFVKMDVHVTKEGMQGDVPELAALARSVSVRTNFTIPDSIYQANVKRVEIICNRKFNYPIIIDRNSPSADRFFDWNASNQFSFVARELKPGNEYRHTDIRNTDKYNSYDVNARFGDIETSNLFVKGRRDENGAEYLTDYNDVNADYLNVTFRLRPPETIKSSIFLVGAFNDWKVLPDYEMYDDNGLMYLNIQLKRGIYDYQYVTGDIVGDSVENVNWEILEGNFWETENDYYVFLYYRATDKGGYDKIIGYKKINTGGL